MRADRLLSILLILQARGCTTAQYLSRELEVSVRTIYRDVDALCTAGIPLYTERGPGGGISLLDSYRSNLTHLTENEIHTLFMMTLSTPLSELGMTQQINNLLRKLRISFPADTYSGAQDINQRLYVDWTAWHPPSENTPYLESLRDAVWECRLVKIKYHTQVRNNIVERLLAPYSLVAKAGLWYLIGATLDTKRVYRVSQIAEVQQLSKKFIRPADYDLISFWHNWCKDYEDQRTLYEVQARIKPQLIPYLNYIMGNHVNTRELEKKSPENDGWISVELRFESFEMARGYLLNCGSALEIIEPEALKESVIDYAKQVVSIYTQS